MNLSFELVLTIFGTIISIYLGILGIKYTLKHRNKTELIFLNNSCISLFKAVVKSFDEIEINFKGKKITENIIVLKGTIFNSGNIDIDESIIHKPVSIQLPDNYYWMQSKIIDCSNDELKIIQKIEEDKLTFNWDLLKSNEYFTFDSVIEFKSNPELKTNEINITNNLEKGLKFEHRITNLHSIETMVLPSKRNNIAVSLAALVYFFGFLGIFLYFSIGQVLFPKYDIKNVAVINKKSENVSFFPKSLKEVEIRNDDKTLFTLSNSDFGNFTKNSITPIIEKREINYWTLSFFGILSIIIIIGLFYLIKKYFKDKQTYQKLKILVDKYSDKPQNVKSISNSLFH